MAYQERVLDGRRALDTDGDHAAAVVLFQTSSEVLLNKVLTLLLWEEKVFPVTAAGDFYEGQVVKRLQTMSRGGSEDRGRRKRPDRWPTGRNKARGCGTGSCMAATVPPEERPTTPTRRC